MSNLHLDDFRRCPSCYCGQPINITAQKEGTGGEFFICPDCELPAFMMTNGELAAAEEHERERDNMRSVAGE